MAEDRCLHTDLLVSQCGCPKHRDASNPTWEAKFPGSCQTCGQKIEVGERVKWTSDGLYPQHQRH